MRKNFAVTLGLSLFIFSLWASAFFFSQQNTPSIENTSFDSLQGFVAEATVFPTQEFDSPITTSIPQVGYVRFQPKDRLYQVTVFKDRIDLSLGTLSPVDIFAKRYAELWTFGNALHDSEVHTILSLYFELLDKSLLQFTRQEKLQSYQINKNIASWVLYSSNLGSDRRNEYLSKLAEYEKKLSSDLRLEEKATVALAQLPSTMQGHTLCFHADERNAFTKDQLEYSHILLHTKNSVIETECATDVADVEQVQVAWKAKDIAWQSEWQQDTVSDEKKHSYFNRFTLPATMKSSEVKGFRLTVPVASAKWAFVEVQPDEPENKQVLWSSIVFPHTAFQQALDFSLDPNQFSRPLKLVVFSPVPLSAEELQSITLRPILGSPRVNVTSTLVSTPEIYQSRNTFTANRLLSKNELLIIDQHLPFFWEIQHTGSEYSLVFAHKIKRILLLLSFTTLLASGVILSAPFLMQKKNKRFLALIEKAKTAFTLPQLILGKEDEKILLCGMILLISVDIFLLHTHFFPLRIVTLLLLFIGMGRVPARYLATIVLGLSSFLALLPLSFVPYTRPRILEYLVWTLLLFGVRSLMPMQFLIIDTHWRKDTYAIFYKIAHIFSQQKRLLLRVLIFVLFAVLMGHTYWWSTQFFPTGLHHPFLSWFGIPYLMLALSFALPCFGMYMLQSHFSLKNIFPGLLTLVLATFLLSTTIYTYKVKNALRTKPIIFTVSTLETRFWDEVVITGKNFGVTPSNAGRVTIGEQEQQVLTWSSTKIKFLTDPYKTTSGLLYIQNADQKTSNALPFLYTSF